jgi:hypothetical protein
MASQTRVVIAHAFDGERRNIGWRVMGCSLCPRRVQVSPTVAALLTGNDMLCCESCGEKVTEFLRDYAPERVAGIVSGPPPQP